VHAKAEFMGKYGEATKDLMRIFKTIRGVKQIPVMEVHKLVDQMIVASQTY